MKIISVWKKIFKDWKYLTLGVFITFLFYSFNVLLANYKGVISFYSSNGFKEALSFFFILFLGFGKSIKLHSFISLIIISILFGMLFSILIYKTKIITNSKNKKTSLIGSFGVFIGILAPGCAACGIGLLSFLGISAAFLNFLPFEGLELSILSIILLGYATFKISSNLLECDICKIHMKDEDND